MSASSYLFLRAEWESTGATADCLPELATFSIGAGVMNPNPFGFLGSSS